MSILSSYFCQTKFSNPLVLASGILGITSNSYHRTIEKGAGGITTKSIWLKPHNGHANPTMFGTKNYVMNAVGLPDAGINKAKTELEEYLPKRKAPLIVSITGGKLDDFVEIAEKIDELVPDFIEVNISCPNVEDEFGTPFAYNTISAAKITKAIKAKTKTPIIIKLSPNVQNIAEIAKAVEESGADAICAINTVGPGMRFNIDLKSAILSNKVGGISGPAIFPLTVKAVFDIYRAVKIPIIATGGVNSARDALELIMAGGSLVGVGTAIYYHGDDFWESTIKEMKDWLDFNKYTNITELIGLFHKK